MKEILAAMNKLPFSPGLENTLKEIVQLEEQGLSEEAIKKTQESIEMIRVSGIALRCELAKLFSSSEKFEDICSAIALYKKALEHINTESHKERPAADAIKKAIEKATKKLQNTKK